jgi:AbrB family looped-hinge helix DNA binding protein
MDLVVDKLGRVVIPKPLRDRLGLQAGAHLEITERDGTLVLKPSAECSARLEMRNGLLVHTGSKPAGDMDIGRLLARLRDERDLRNIGWPGAAE